MATSTSTIQLIPKLQPEAYSSTVVAPHLEILEQPAEFYRYRYESEIADGRVGGLLLGRSSSGTNKSFMKVRISGIDSHHHKKLQLIVCTVNPEKAPHPYYLHGDNCQNGFFKWEKTVDDMTQSSIDVIFDRLAVICISKSAKAIADGMKKRKEFVPGLLHCPEEPLHKYEGRNMGKIRLAFGLSFSDCYNQDWTVMPIFSDEISDTRINKNDATVNILFKGADNENRTAEIVCPVKDMKKHFLTFTSPDVGKYISNDRVKAVVTVHVGFTKSNELTIAYDRTLQPIGENGRKRPR